MGLIGRRYTAAMPSRPVLIGRGLATQTLHTTPQTPNTTHSVETTVSRPQCRDTSGHVTHTAQQRTTACSRPLIQPTTRYKHGQPEYGHTGGLLELRRPQRQGNTRTHPEPGS